MEWYSESQTSEPIPTNNTPNPTNLLQENQRSTLLLNELEYFLGHQRFSAPASPRNSAELAGRSWNPEDELFLIDFTQENEMENWESLVDYFPFHSKEDVKKKCIEMREVGLLPCWGTTMAEDEETPEQRTQLSAEMRKIHLEKIRERVEGLEEEVKKSYNKISEIIKKHS